MLVKRQKEQENKELAWKWWGNIHEDWLRRTDAPTFRVPFGTYAAERARRQGLEDAPRLPLPPLPEASGGDNVKANIQDKEDFPQASLLKQSLEALVKNRPVRAEIQNKEDNSPQSSSVNGVTEDNEGDVTRLRSRSRAPPRRT